KRIVMLQKSKSKQIQLVRYALLIPMVFGMLIYSSCSDENNLSNQQDEMNLSQYSYTIQVGKDNPEDFKKKHEASIEFIKNNPEYAHWLETDYSKQPVSIKSSIHPKSEIIPDGYKIVEIDTEEGSKKTIVYGFVGEPSSGTSNTSEFDGKDEVPFSVISQVPIFPGCEGETEGVAQKGCFNTEVSTFVAENFNTELGKTLNLTGVVKISVFFKID